MNKKGQALIEFILVLPIFLLLILAAFDFVNIMHKKMELENVLEEVIDDERYPLDDSLALTKEKDDNLITYHLSANVKVISPFITIVTDDIYKVSVQRTVYDK